MILYQYYILSWPYQVIISMLLCHSRGKINIPKPFISYWFYFFINRLRVLRGIFNKTSSYVFLCFLFYFWFSIFRSTISSGSQRWLNIVTIILILLFFLFILSFIISCHFNFCLLLYKFLNIHVAPSYSYDKSFINHSN